MKDRKRIIILGLDGCTWQLLNPLMDEGIMPHLKTIVDNGASGILDSTLPPYTAPAWVSCVTGVNPGKHGVFGFTLKKNGLLDGRFVDSTRVGVPRIWDYVNQAGFTAGIINVPVTYPVRPLNGFMVPCFLTPLGKENYTYPESIYSNYLVPNHYKINVRLAAVRDVSEATVTRIINDLKNMTASRSRVMEELREAYDPDFFIIVFQCLDKVQHKFWKYIDPGDPMSRTEPAKKMRPLILTVYQLIDDIIGQVFKSLDENTTLYLVSDHGFGSHRKQFFINKWLAQNDFLDLKNIKMNLNRLIKKFSSKVNFYEKNVDILIHPIYNFIKLGNSEFIGSDPYEQGIYYLGNPKDSTYSRRVDVLKKKLISLIDPDTGQRLFDNVYHRTELYVGNYTNEAPDIVLQFKDTSYAMTQAIPRRNRYFQSIANPSGCHQPEGIFAAYGADIAAGTKIRASMPDIASTVLHNMELPVHRRLDGRVHECIFTQTFQNNHSLVFSDDDTPVSVLPLVQADYSDHEKDEIAARLKDLGYFG